jgi:hypothetical protein
MRLRQGPRPLAIRAFSALFLLQAALSFWHQMSDLAATQAMLAATFPQLVVDRDLAIVATSARLTIALIPVALIWFLGARFARILVLVFVAGRLLTVPDGPSSSEIVSLLLAVLAAAILLSPGASRWFRKRPVD